ncbi:MAG: carboxymuconolactone decarboxylase family protein, partial [Alphaproteobacteria bacterium]|nr:carboxymuconolactone decarboxylase family protein [Alphaproteobacteria bacterium]
MTQDTRRLAPLPADHDPGLQPQFAGFLNSLGFVPNSVLTMQRKPKLVQAFMAMQAAIWDPSGKVDRGLKRLIAFAASRTVGDAYSMAHTASGALHFGITEDKLDATFDYATSAHFSAAERAALDLAVHASRVPHAVTDEAFAALRAHWSEEEIVEIVATIAMAGFLARWNGTMLTPLEDEPR